MTGAVSLPGARPLAVRDAERSGLAAMTATKPKILYLVTEDWYFLSHRLALARAAAAAGYDVVVAARDTGQSAAIAAAGLRFVPIGLKRTGRNPFGELRAVLELRRLYRRERPDLVHQVALKPVLYGSFAAGLAGVAVMVNALTGLGYVFASTERLARLLRAPISVALRFCVNRAGSVVLLQNSDDARLLIDARIVERARVAVIRGSGVDTMRFRPLEKPAANPTPQPPIAVMVSRMLRDKGVAELVDAARALRERRVPIRVVLVGSPDPGNPASIGESLLRGWAAAGHVEWWGARNDVAKFLPKCQIAVLPSYREGLPRSLLEAAACGLPMVAADVPGCREIVRHEETGLLVPPRNAGALANALARLARDGALRAALGRRAREVVEREFSEPIMIGQTLALYGGLLAAHPVAVSENFATADSSAPEVSE